MRLALSILALVAAFGAQLASASLGMDTASSVTADQFKCLKGAGIDHVIIRAWHSYGGFDSNAPPTLKNAQAAGVSRTGVYLFPCAGQDAAQQVHEMMASLSSAGISTSGLEVWMDIETNPSSGCGWPAPGSGNCNYIATLLQTANSLGAKAGVYLSHYMYGQILGSEDCSAITSYPLWDAHYTGNPSCSGFEPYGGFTSPSVTQYDDNGSQCGVSYDTDVDC